jgi:hypothetical protein
METSKSVLHELERSKLQEIFTENEIQKISQNNLRIFVAVLDSEKSQNKGAKCLEMNNNMGTSKTMQK